MPPTTNNQQEKQEKQEQEQEKQEQEQEQEQEQQQQQQQQQHYLNLYAGWIQHLIREYLIIEGVCSLFLCTQLWIGMAMPC